MKNSQKQSANPRVGIFMPAYNQGQYIYEAIESLKKQTFQDFKVYIVDDASTDGVTIETLKKIKYPKAEVFLNSVNQGVSNLTRIYHEKLNTEYVFVFCADDVIKPTYVEACVKYLDNHPDDGAVATWVQYFGDDDSLLKIDQRKARLPDMLIANNYLGSSMARYQAMKDIGFGNTDKVLQKHSDYDRWVSVLEKGWTLGVINKTLFQYRQVSTSLRHSINTAEEMGFRKKFITKHRALFDKYYYDVIMGLHKQVQEIREREIRLSSDRDWLDNQYHKLNTETNAEIKNLNSKIGSLEKYSKYSIYPLAKYAKKIINKFHKQV